MDHSLAATKSSGSNRGHSFEVRLFGPFEALVDGRSIGPFRSKKSRWLLAMLAMRANRAVERSWLSATLWPDSDAEHGLAALRTTLKDVRRALGPESWRLASEAGRVVRLDMSGASLDVDDFEAAVRTQDCHKAAEFCRGPLLEGWFEDWTTDERARREADAIAVLEEAANAALGEANWTLAQSYAQRALSISPYRESSFRLLLHSLASADNYAAVEKEFGRFRKLLWRDLKLEPDSETLTLAQTIRRRRKFAISAMAPRSRRSAPCQYHIRKPITRLIGREELVSQVSTKLRLNRLVTLVGTGGIGKTRVAMEVSDRIRGDFSWGACVVELGSVDDPADVPGAIIQALGIRLRPGSEPKSALANALDGSDLLLVLDNCEHLLEACAIASDHMLQHAATLKILATSREPLGLTGETRVKVPPLDFEPTSEGGDSQAAQLFFERVEQVGAIRTWDGEQVRHLCKKLDGLPLAIEMAAAQSESFTLDEIMQKLDHRFEFLRATDPTSPSRQRTLKGTIDWSYTYLSEVEKEILQRVSYFPAGLAVSGAMKALANCEFSAGMVNHNLNSLARKSMLEISTEDSGGRVRLMESVRSYAREAAEQDGATDRWQRCMAEWLVAHDESVTPQERWDGSWMRYIRREMENYRAAISWCHKSSEEAVSRQDLAVAATSEMMALKLVNACALYWHRCSYMDGALAALEMSIAHGKELVGRLDPQVDEARRLWSLLAVALRQLGNITEQGGNSEEALNIFTQSLAICRRLGDRREEASVCYGMALAHAGLDRVKEMHGLLQFVLETGIELDDAFLQTTAYVWLGYVAGVEGDFDRSEELHRLAYRVAKDSKNLARAAAAAVWLASHPLRQGKCDEALELGREGMVGLVEHEFTVPFSGALQIVARVMFARDAGELAAKLLGAADALSSSRTRVSTTFRKEKAEFLESVRKRLGKDAFDEAYSCGARLNLQEALELGLYDPQ